MIVPLIPTILSGLALIFDIFMASAHFNEFTQPYYEGLWEGIQTKVDRQYGNQNLICYILISLIAFGLAALILAIIEIALFITTIPLISLPQIVLDIINIFKSKVIRGLMMFFIGLNTLSVAADFGIAAGTFGMFMGVVLVVAEFLVDDIKPNDNDQKEEKPNDNDQKEEKPNDNDQKEEKPNDNDE